jgi:NAD(P)-dependent dehydrogenase (short-subunit alcohol dehydrogenase family)
MANRVLIVSGGAQGIGKALTEGFLDEGWCVAVFDADSEACAEIRPQLAGDHLVLEVDVSDVDSVENGVRVVLERWGRVDGLVNNAGVSVMGVPVEILDITEWNRVIGTNLTGAFLCARAAVAPLRKTRGAIVNIASTRALQSEKHSEAYAASKGGLVALTHALAVSLGPEIRVNCISPGWIEVGPLKKESRRYTPELRPVDHQQHPAGRVGHADDVVQMVRFLLGEESGFVTGQNFVVDGGMTKRMIYA